MGKAGAAMRMVGGDDGRRIDIRQFSKRRVVRCRAICGCTSRGGANYEKGCIVFIEPKAACYSRAKRPIAKLHMLRRRPSLDEYDKNEGAQEK